MTRFIYLLNRVSVKILEVQFNHETENQLKVFRMTYLQLRQTAEQVKYSSGKKEYMVILSSDSSPQKRSLRA